MFQIEVSAASKFVVQLVALDAVVDPLLRVYDADLNLVAKDDDGGGWLNSRASVHLKPGAYYVSAGSFADASVGRYRLILQRRGDDYGDSFPSATRLQIDGQGHGQRSGRIDHAGDRDMFKFTAPATGRALVRLTGAGQLDPLLVVYSSGGRLIGYSDNTGRSRDSQLAVPLVADKLYFLESRGSGQSVGRYRLSVSTTPKARKIESADTGAAESARFELPVGTSWVLDRLKWQASPLRAAAATGAGAQAAGQQGQGPKLHDTGRGRTIARSPVHEAAPAGTPAAQSQPTARSRHAAGTQFVTLHLFEEVIKCPVQPEVVDNILGDLSLPL